MIDKQKVIDAVEAAIEGTDNFLVDVEISADNIITVEIDNPHGVDVDSCAAVNRAVEAVLDRDTEDFELEVGSAGLTSPFKVKGQYVKNVGNDVVVLTRNGKKLHGKLVEASDESFTISVEKKVKLEGKKRPELVAEEITIPYSEAKSVTYDLKFK